MKKMIPIFIFIGIQVVFLIFYITVAKSPYNTPHCYYRYEEYEGVKPPKYCKEGNSYSFPFYTTVDWGFVLFYLPLMYTVFKDYSGSAFFLTLLAVIFACEWGTFTNSFFFHCFRQYKKTETAKHRFLNVNVGTSIASSASVALSFGALLGTVNFSQILLMTFIETIFNSMISHLAFAYKPFRISDRGGAIVLYSFAAFFALGCSFMLNRKKGQQKGASTPITVALSIFAIAYTAFYDLSTYNTYEGTDKGFYVNGYYIDFEDYEHESMNIQLAKYGSFFTCFFTSLILNGGKIKLEEILFSAIAGFITISGSAFFILFPSVSFAIGILGGIITFLCNKFLRPILESKLKYYDAMGILYWFGIPGFLSALTEAIVIATMGKKYWVVKREDGTEDDYRLSALYYQMSGYLGYDEKPHLVRTVGKVAGFVFLYEIIVIIIAIVAGALTGFLMNLEFWGKAEKLSDEEFFITESGDSSSDTPSPAQPANPINSERIALKQ